jgi:hypothetical protein
MVDFYRTTGPGLIIPVHYFQLFITVSKYKIKGIN